MPPLKPRQRTLLLVFLAVLTAYFVLVRFTGILPIEFEREEPLAVTALAVRFASTPQVVPVAGVLEPSEETAILSPAAGKIIELRVKPGEAVRRGTTVAVLHSAAPDKRDADRESAVAAAQKELALKERLLEDAADRLERFRRLLERDLIARRDHEEARAQVDGARAEVDFARAHLAQREAMQAQSRALESKAEVRAPAGGILLRWFVGAGDSVAEGAPVAVVGDAARLRLAIELDGEFADDLRPGLAVELSSPAAPGQRLAGDVVKVNRSVGVAKSTVRLEVHALAGEGFSPGAAVAGKLYLDRGQTGPRLPSGAVISAQGKSYVYVVSAGRASLREVIPGATLADATEIRHGLVEDEIVIIDPLDSLSPGRRVSATLLGQPAPAS